MREDVLTYITRNLDKIRMTVGLVFQDPDDQLFAPSVWADVAFGPKNRGLSKREVAERADNALNILNIVDLSRRMNIALIITTHDVDAVPQYADKIYVMRKGRFVAEGTPDAVFSDASVIRTSHLRLPLIAHLMEILHKEGGQVANTKSVSVDY
jgi:cobalt/nickel transport system ATP-binding protein